MTDLSLSEDDRSSRDSYEDDDNGDTGSNKSDKSGRGRQARLRSETDDDTSTSDDDHSAIEAGVNISDSDCVLFSGSMTRICKKLPP